MASIAVGMASMATAGVGTVGTGVLGLAGQRKHGWKHTIARGTLGGMSLVGGPVGLVGTLGGHAMDAHVAVQVGNDVRTGFVWPLITFIWVAFFLLLMFLAISGAYLIFTGMSSTVPPDWARDLLHVTVSWDLVGIGALGLVFGFGIGLPYLLVLYLDSVEQRRIGLVDPVQRALLPDIQKLAADENIPITYANREMRARILDLTLRTSMTESELVAAGKERLNGKFKTQFLREYNAERFGKKKNLPRLTQAERAEYARERIRKLKPKDVNIPFGNRAYHQLPGVPAVVQSVAGAVSGAVSSVAGLFGFGKSQ
jgi:hypothetical protein